tara:strand:- start:2838 stop:2954 length:117 start_codon:yes stop_codon:yes gene_type:complete
MNFETQKVCVKKISPEHDETDAGLGGRQVSTEAKGGNR